MINDSEGRIYRRCGSEMLSPVDLFWRGLHDLYRHGLATTGSYPCDPLFTVITQTESSRFLPCRTSAVYIRCDRSLALVG